jgi:hypothetical protein
MATVCDGGREVRDATGTTAATEFQRSEFYEILLDIMRDEPRRYAKEVSAGQRRRVQLYEERKMLAASADTKARAA